MGDCGTKFGSLMKDWCSSPIWWGIVSAVFLILFCLTLFGEIEQIDVDGNTPPASTNLLQKTSEANIDANIDASVTQGNKFTDWDAFVEQVETIRGFNDDGDISFLDWLAIQEAWDGEGKVLSPDDEMFASYVEQLFENFKKIIKDDEDLPAVWESLQDPSNLSEQYELFAQYTSFYENTAWLPTVENFSETFSELDEQAKLAEQANLDKHLDRFLKVGRELSIKKLEEIIDAEYGDNSTPELDVLIETFLGGEEKEAKPSKELFEEISARVYLMDELKESENKSTDTYFSEFKKVGDQEIQDYFKVVSQNIDGFSELTQEDAADWKRIAVALYFSENSGNLDDFLTDEDVKTTTTMFTEYGEKELLYYTRNGLMSKLTEVADETDMSAGEEFHDMVSILVQKLRTDQVNGKIDMNNFSEICIDTTIWRKTAEPGESEIAAAKKVFSYDQNIKFSELLFDNMEYYAEKNLLESSATYTESSDFEDVQVPGFKPLDFENLAKLAGSDEEHVFQQACKAAFQDVEGMNTYFDGETELDKRIEGLRNMLESGQKDHEDLLNKLELVRNLASLYEQPEQD